MAQAEGARPKSHKNKKLMLVRYGKMGFLGWFEHNEENIPKVSSRVVIKTQRGLELGDIVGQFNYRSGQFRSSPEQVGEYFSGKSKDYPLGRGGTFVRFATEEDLMEEKHLEASAKEEAECCRRFIKEMNLPMKVIDSEHLFGGERIVIYFSSNGRVDFRELVRRLAREYQTRIELRQIGSRDEAKLISDFESCGQECCCRRFLKVLEPVNMRMAKLQKATLDPSKISGHCGRLKCCLRYEDETYRDLKARLPRKNTFVKTPHGPGKVVGGHVLTQLVIVQDEKGDREVYPVEEIQIDDAGTGVSSNNDDKDVPRGKPADLRQDSPAEKENASVDEDTSNQRQDNNNSTGAQRNGKNNRKSRNRRRRNRNRNRDAAGNTGGKAAPGAKTDTNPDNSGTNRRPDQGRTNDS